jgi:predicted nucleic acid-binding protein
VIVVDSSIMVAYMNAGDDHHERVADWIDGVDADLVTTPLIVAEVDHLVAARGGAAVRRAFHQDLLDGGYLVDWWPTAAVDSVKVARAYADANVGLADASLVAVAARSGTADIATLDERHFRLLRPLEGAEAFRLLPADV